MKSPFNPSLNPLRFDRDGDWVHLYELWAYTKDNPPSVGQVEKYTRGINPEDWPSEATIRLPDDSTRTGPGTDFRPAHEAEIKKLPRDWLAKRKEK